uniref:DUF4347 domain-containing protein n=1 Tax=Aquabacterium sp. TaxID=1872578 RepID=UPI00378439D3
MSSFAAPEYFCLSAIEGLGQPQPQAVLFIDSRVPELQTLIAAAEPGVKVVVLEANQDGLHQMAQALSGLKDLSAVSV